MMVDGDYAPTLYQMAMCTPCATIVHTYIYRCLTSSRLESGVAPPSSSPSPSSPHQAVCARVASVTRVVLGHRVGSGQREEVGRAAVQAHSQWKHDERARARERETKDGP